MKLSDMPNVVTLIAKWESELKRFKFRDPACAAGQSMIYRAMPSKCMKDIDTEKAKGAITDYPSMMEFIKQLSPSQRFASAKPIEEPPQPEWALDGWVNWIE